jgi:predicted acetyltransferase
MANSQLPVETARPQDWDDVWRLISAAFHNPRNEQERESERTVYEPERGLLVRDGDLVVAHAGTYSRELVVPGAVLAAAHVTQVAVAATHRRQGLLRRLMTRQLRDIRAAGREPVAVLWASEGRIYPRFGYGQATQRLQLRVATHEVGPPAPAGPVRVADPMAVRTELADLYDRLRPDRPGWSSRDERWWTHLLRDPSAGRHGATDRGAALHHGPTELDGYALFRTRSEWKDWSPEGEVQVGEVVAATAEAYAALWRFLLTVDLTRRLNYPFAALDEPLQHLVQEPRRLGGRLLDGLWVRLVDVPAALSARRYATDIDTVFEVADDLLPENTGRWRLVGGPDGARCTRTDEPADLVCDVRDLATGYLGGPSLTTLLAGRVRELRPGAAVRAGVAFGWHRQPASLEVF